MKTKEKYSTEKENEPRWKQEAAPRRMDAHENKAAARIMKKTLLTSVPCASVRRVMPLLFGASLRAIRPSFRRPPALILNKKRASVVAVIARLGTRGAAEIRAQPRAPLGKIKNCVTSPWRRNESKAARPPLASHQRPAPAT